VDGGYSMVTIRYLEHINLTDDVLIEIIHVKSKGYYATGVHINNNIYSVFNNKMDLEGVNKFKQQFVAIPCGWWI
jgi:hypothetical protein